MESNKHLFKGVVLDIGGRDRGRFIKPREQVKEWIFADICTEHNPDIILDVSNMKNIASGSIDTILAAELFEHVKYPEKGINECSRVLKKDGLLIISVPFLFPIHADPQDFQRWTSYKWIEVLSENSFNEIEIYPMGGTFTIISEISYEILKIITPGYLRYFRLFLRWPIDLVSSFDRLSNRNTEKYVQGYFITAAKN